MNININQKILTMKTLLAIFIMLFAVQGIAKAQKDSIVITKGIDQKDQKRIAKNLKKQIKEGNLKAALSSTSQLNTALTDKDLEKIIKKNIFLENIDIAHEAAQLNNRDLKFKEVFSTFKEENYLKFDSLNYYIKSFEQKEIELLQNFYIEVGDVRSAEKCVMISGKHISGGEYVAMSKVYFRQNDVPSAVAIAKRGGVEGREELGKLLMMYINVRDVENVITIASAIGYNNLTNRERNFTNRVIPNSELEEKIEKMKRGDIPPLP